MAPTSQSQLPSSPYLKANIISKLFFWWLNAFFGKGNKKALDLGDLYQALPNDRSKFLGDRIEQLWKEEVKRCEEGKKPRKPSLRRVIIKQFGAYYMMVGMLAFLEECFIRIAQPICLGLLLHSFSPEYSASKTEKWLSAAGVVLGSAMYTFTHHPYFFGVQYVGMKIRIACCSLIYRKALRLSQAALGKSTIGEMTNLISNDVSRFDQSTIFLHYLWIGPIQTAIVTGILWHFYGVACLAGLSILVLFVPFQGYMGKRFSTLRESTAIKTDRRIRVMNEIVGGMRAIKMYAWEKPFSILVGESRKDEIKVIKKTNTLRAVNMSVFYTSSKIIIFLTLITYVLTENSLTAVKVFVTFALYNNVRLIMTLFFPNGVSQLGEGLVSIRRIENFLLMEERITSSKSTLSSHSSIGATGTIKFTNFCANWTPEQATLNNINLNVGNKELFAIVGHVGSGKTSLLQSILGELPATSGKIRASGTLGYTSQEPWVFSGSVRENILFGRVYDDERYNQVVEACALSRDLDLLPNRDNSLVGEKGSSLSGGQKARITLARAVYANADIYLLDDPLSAVDAEVGRHIFDQCICGILKEKTRILVTHQLHLLQSVNQIVLLEDGFIRAQGNYEKISSFNTTESVLLKNPIRNRTTSEASSSSIPYVARSGSFGIGMNEMGVGSTYSINVEEFDDYLDTGCGDDLKTRSDGVSPSDTLLKSSIPKLNEEISATGRVNLGLYVKYFKSGSNICTLTLLIFGNIATQVLYAGADWWLSFWTKSQEGKSKTNESQPIVSPLPKSIYHDRDVQIEIYSGLICGLFFASLLRTMVFFNICMTASVNLHESMFLGVLRAPMKFFETNPIGRILSRISKDIGCIDDILPPTMFDTMEIFLNVVGILVLVTIVNYYLLVPAFVIVVVFYFLRKFYLRTARSVKRIEGITRSPVFSHLSTSLSGLSTIRAFKVESNFIKQFDDYQDMHTSSWYIFLAVSRWFGIWLDWISVSWIAFVTFSFMFFNDSGANIGLAVSSAMTLTGMCQWGVRQSAEVENQMVSVERVMEYTQLEPEASLETPKGKTPPPNDWPSSGEIIFEHVQLKYGNEEPVLKDITCVIKPSEKIGIVGRTGAGKSSLISALFRIAEPTGSILIDGLDILNLGLQVLRSHISIIPQDPVLFTGTLRVNLDPFNSFRDSELWDVLEQVHLAHDVKQLASGLDMEISEGGANFSLGQRQLVCLARAILKNNKILVLDEATSNIDNDTDTLIQGTIRTKFANCTVLSVAHRLHTVMDCDKILVLDAGSILEFDEPYTLLQNNKSSLYGLAEQSGALADLINISKEAALQRKLAKVESIN